jgi:hypothetical protein
MINVQEAAMYGRFSSTLVRMFVVTAFVAVALAPTIRADEGSAVSVDNPTIRSQVAPQPIVLAQGRCFNGRCF